jgi:formylmethanofuran dehydrogenase subunit C
MALTLQLRTATTIPLELEGFTPAAARGKSLAELERFEVFYGNAKQPLAEFFALSGDAADETLVFSGDLSGVHWIGAKMTSGTIRIEGDAGRHLGSQMCGGEIEVTGNAGDWVGGELRGGLIRVRGDAGSFVGAAYRGSAAGMTGGTVLIHGHAGNEIGHTLRRGLIAIGGSAGDYIGFNMLAGTIVVAGPPGIRHGACMRRGTIAFVGGHRPTMLPSFRFSCRFRPEMLTLLAQELARLKFELPSGAIEPDYELYSGDLIEGGRGEILIATP